MKTKTIRSAALAAALSAIVSLSFSVRTSSAEDPEPTPVADGSAQYNAFNKAYKQSHQAVVDDANTKAATAGQGEEEEDSGSCA